MSEAPKRIVQDERASASARELVRAWDTEKPPEGARAATLLALGLAPAKLPSTLHANAGTGPFGGWLKVIAGAMLLGALGGAALLFASHRAAAVTPSLAESATRVAAPPSSEASDAAATDQKAPRDLVLPPPVPSTSVKSHVGAAGAGGLGAELAIVDGARTALERGEPANALARVNDYESRFKTGSFVEEAEVIRIRALLAQGRGTDAERVASQFLSTYPMSPHEARVRALIAHGPTRRGP